MKQISITGQWHEVVSTSSGQICYAVTCANDGGIFKSTDYGNNWTDITGTAGTTFWRSICCSSDGLYVYAVCGENYSGNNIQMSMIKSTDGGDTWSSPVRVNDDPPGRHVGARGFKGIP